MFNDFVRKFWSCYDNQTRVLQLVKILSLYIIIQLAFHGSVIEQLNDLVEVV